MSVTMQLGMQHIELRTALARLIDGDGTGLSTYPSPRPTHGGGYIRKLNIWRFFELGSRSGPPTHNDSEQVVQSSSLEDLDKSKSPNISVSGAR